MDKQGILLFGIEWLPHTWPLLIMVSLVVAGAVGGAVVELVQDRKSK
jgi:hypothetical protein